ncbi:hypothetical protein F8388_019948 [Cannabis sativa]|uniref:Uncharacterized protein n=1 Tax=Cannabis sativa TaxID=3483 RepID=A0A7J6G1E8_CANSA|nr:hypothetical protein G4B88_026418 [Cannabis sativa]KAF4390293.1 hypothetical protein F8388_019948 [Cannabis sativa]
MVSFEMNDRKNPLLLRGDSYNRTKVLYAILHETSKFQGNNFIRSWLFLGSYRLAHLWHDFGGVWVHCALQWFLAYTSCFSAEDTCSWMVATTALY